MEYSECPWNKEHNLIHVGLQGKELSKEERAEMAKAPFSLEDYKDSLKINAVYGEKGYSTNERNSIRPTLDVNGIWGGYTGEGAKTVIASKAYIKQYGKPEHPRELDQHQCICYSNLAAPSKWQFRRRDEKDLSIDVPATILCNSAQMELAMVQANHGICRLPEFAIKELMGSEQIEFLFTDFDPVSIDVFAVYPSKKHLSPKIRLLIDLLVSRLNGAALK